MMDSEKISKEFLLSKQESIMNDFKITEKEFGLILYWFENEPTQDSKSNEPIAVVKDLDGEDVEDNYIVVSCRMSDAIDYARGGGFDLKED